MGYPSDMSAIPPLRRTDFPVLRPIQTRWMDNDHYGHVNNVAYYSFFDTAVNGFLIDATGTDIRALPAIGLVAETGCQFFKPLSFPEAIDAALEVERLGSKSVVYRLALFRVGDEEPCAAGRLVHVYVDRDTRVPVPIPDAIRSALEPVSRRRPG